MKKIILFCVISLVTSGIPCIAQPKAAVKTPAVDNNFGTKEEHLFNFTGTIYYLERTATKLPDFRTLKPMGKIYTKELNITKQSFTKGFPGVSNRFEYFAIDYKGKFYIKEDNEYCFMLGSDDGSKLFIDDKLVIDNDYNHALRFKTACIPLTKGMHKIQVQYYQGPAFEVALMLSIRKKEDTTFEVFDLIKYFPIAINENSTMLTISIGDDLLYETNSYLLSDIAKEALSEIKRVLLDNMNYTSVVIEGHTDDVGSEKSNLILSEKRAKNVHSYLVGLGLSSTKLKTKGMGETAPIVSNTNSDNRKKNRRVEIKIMK